MRTQWWETDFPIKCSRAATQFWLMKNTENTLHVCPLFLTLGWNKKNNLKRPMVCSNSLSSEWGFWMVFFFLWLFSAHIEAVGDITAMATSFIIKGFNLWQLSSRMSTHADRKERHKYQEHENGKKKRSRQTKSCLSSASASHLWKRLTKGAWSPIRFLSRT